MKYFLTVNGEKYEIDILKDGLLKVNGEERTVDFKSMGEHAIFSLIIDHQSFEAVVEQREGQYHVMIGGVLYEIEITDERTIRLAKGRSHVDAPTGEISVKAPMPGLIVKVPVSVGQEIKKGQAVVILESMKMENELKAPRDGIIKHIDVKGGDSVAQNQPLVTIA